MEFREAFLRPSLLCESTILFCLVRLNSIGKMFKTSIVFPLVEPISLAALLAIIGKQVWMDCECESLNWLLKIDFNWFMMMIGSLLAWIQKLVTKATTFTLVFRLFLVILSIYFNNSSSSINYDHLYSKNKVVKMYCIISHFLSLSVFVCVYFFLVIFHITVFCF